MIFKKIVSKLCLSTVLFSSFAANICKAADYVLAYGSHEPCSMCGGDSGIRGSYFDIATQTFFCDDCFCSQNARTLIRSLLEAFSSPVMNLNFHRTRLHYNHLVELFHDVHPDRMDENQIKILLSILTVDNRFPHCLSLRSTDNEMDFTNTTESPTVVYLALRKLLFSIILEHNMYSVPETLTEISFENFKPYIS